MGVCVHGNLKPVLMYETWSLKLQCLSNGRHFTVRKSHTYFLWPPRGGLSLGVYMWCIYAMYLCGCTTISRSASNHRTVEFEEFVRSEGRKYLNLCWGAILRPLSTKYGSRFSFPSLFLFIILHFSSHSMLRSIPCMSCMPHSVHEGPCVFEVL